MSNTSIEKEDEIDLLALVKKIWDKRLKIIKYFVVFLFIGIFIAIFSPKQYTATTTFIPQNAEKGSGLSGLASLAGINLGNAPSENISVALYPNLMKSIPFQKEMIQTKIQTEKQTAPLAYWEYYEKYPQKNILGTIQKYTIGLPSVILQSFRGEKVEKTSSANTTDSNLYQITEKEKDFFNQLGEQLKTTVNEKQNYITISFSAEEPLIAAQMTQKAQELLQRTITEFKIKKATEKLDFIQDRYNEAEKDFKEKQLRLASFQDANRGLITSLPQTRQAQLQSEFNIAYNVYSELAKQLENQKIQVKEDTPVFTIIEPVMIPLEKSKPKRGMIIGIWGILGIVLGVASIFVKDFLDHFKSNNQKD